MMGDDPVADIEEHDKDDESSVDIRLLITTPNFRKMPL